MTNSTTNTLTEAQTTCTSQSGAVERGNWLERLQVGDSVIERNTYKNRNYRNVAKVISIDDKFIKVSHDGWSDSTYFRDSGMEFTFKPYVYLEKATPEAIEQATEEYNRRVYEAHISRGDWKKLSEDTPAAIAALIESDNSSTTTTKQETEPKC